MKVVGTFPASSALDRRSSQAQTAEAGRRGVGQQDGSRRLEADGHRRQLCREIRARRRAERRIAISQTRGATHCNRAEPMPELARQRADGVIDRSKTRDTPHSPVALYAVAHLFGTLVAETILASVHVRAHKEAGHMDASDLIKALQNILRGEGRPHMGIVG